jgi:hypothetical protein
MKSGVISTTKLTFFMFMAFSFFGCADPTSGQLHDLTSGKYTREYWGEWLRMDTNETWYITSSHIAINNNTSSKSVSLAKQSDRVIEVTDNGRKYYLYASRTANASFTGKIAGFEQASPSMQRSVAGGKGWLNVVVEDLDNGSATTVQTDGGGNFTADDIIPGDDYEITPEGGTPTVVTPVADGDDVGTITVNDGVNFKVGITGGTDLNRLYAGDWRYSSSDGSYFSEPYNFGLSIRNTGDTDATATTYELSFDSGLVVVSADYSGILGTIEPEKSKNINIRIGCSSGSITGDYAWKKIGITITDPINNRTWNDSVSLRFFRSSETVSITGSANSMIITPWGQTVRVPDYQYSNRSVIIPRLTGEDYLFVFSGATADSESAYSFSFGSGYYQDSSLGTDTARYEPNNTEDTATVITGGIHAYLHKNDIDYYRFHF